MPNAAKTPPINAPIGAHAITPGPHINPAAAPPVQNRQFLKVPLRLLF